MKVQQSEHLKHLGETPLVQFAESNDHKFHTAPKQLTYDMLNAREGFSADPKPTPNHKAIFPKHCTPKPAQKPCAKMLPQAFQKPLQSLQNHLSNICREFGQNWNRKHPNFGWLEIALALRFFLYVFSLFADLFCAPVLEGITGTLFVGPTGVPCPGVPAFWQALALTRIHSLQEQF